MNYPMPDNNGSIDRCGRTFDCLLQDFEIVCPCHHMAKEDYCSLHAEQRKQKIDGTCNRRKQFAQTTIGDKRYVAAISSDIS